ncbi:MAG: thioredoxin [Patescibacteria group bacterium]
MEYVFTDDNFEEEVLEEELTVLVDFWAPWCGPCRVIGPVIEELAEEFEGKVKVGKLNVDENPGVAQKYSVMSIPTILIFQEGEQARQLVGVRSKEQLSQELESLLAA